MADAYDQSEQVLLGLAVAALRNRIVPRFSQEKAGEAFGTSGQGWAKYENGHAPTIFKPDVQRRLAEALGFSHADLLAEYERLKGEPALSFAPSLRYGRPGANPVRPSVGLLIREPIQAGAWLDAHDLGWEEQKRYAAAPDPRFPADAQYVARVRGDSMDLAGISDGDLAHLVDITAIGYQPVNGNIVEAERTRFGGQLREFTLKQIEVTPDRTLLWPRSTNKRWAEPLDIRQGAAPDEDIQIRVRGLLLKIIRDSYY